MYKVKFIYNPYSGENTIASDLDKIIMIHQEHDYVIVPHRICHENPLSTAFFDIDKSYKYILIAGGDGTIDSVVNVMKEKEINLPIGIIPTGTANDFARYIGMSLDVEEACNQILKSKVKKVDIGKINHKYFMNVASTGLFTDVSQKTDMNLKNTIGKLAYYVKGLEQLPNFRKLKIKVTTDKECFDGNMYLMLVFNGQTAGNLKFAYKAKIDDGLLDVIIIKAGIMKNIINIFIKMVRNEYLENVEGIVYFKTNRLEVECFENIVTDIDGERGPDFPLIIECEKGGISVLGAKI
ncbi:YegS/Rv2252/BmrU family lipid kinase [Clostridium sp.]|uniref:YegS/Rv2252/BmrU family lipid kinase n=1 Tax=Clostridium sp. TaxID=1506 RepID=UPI001A5831BB|nr:YegS/Rv2252/BmrU family lipid kinase [Clostridium sp.]MBK5241549.1 YegS/Rv2252/BmrU family lipid kinase [Clostridium sp.]